MTLLPKHFFNNQIARPKTALFGKRSLVGAVGSALTLPQSGNARMRTPLLLFPKISLRCDFREPCSCPLHLAGGVAEEGEFAAFL